MKKFEEIFRIVKNTRPETSVPETYSIEQKYQPKTWFGKEKWFSIAAIRNENETIWIGKDEYFCYDEALSDYNRLKNAYETEEATITKTQVYP